MSEQQIAQIMEKLGHIIGTMEGMKSKIDEMCTKSGTTDKDVDSLKLWRENIKGQILVWSSIGGIFVTVLMIIVKYLVDNLI
jgi:hypothetical protein